MATATFPTFPGTKMLVTRTPQWNTKVHKSPSGREQRVGYYDAPLYDFELAIEVLRQGNINGKTYAEATALADFYNARKGALQAFNFVDPLDGTTRLVRFAEDKLPMNRLMISLWECTKVKLVEVRA